MKCERCQKNPVRVRVDQIVDGQREARYLCQQCVDELMSTAGQARTFEGRSRAPFGFTANNNRSVSAVDIDRDHNTVERSTENSETVENLPDQSTQFLQELVDWKQNLPDTAWADLLTDAQLGRVALFSVDMLNGFCHEGTLSSPRIKAIIPAVVTAFKDAHAIGVRNFVLPQDCHSPDSVEFADFPPHCQVGSREANTIPELAELPFADLYTIVPKNSLNAFHGTDLGKWLEAHRDLSTAVVVGNCTDLCVYQLAMHLKLYANAHNLKLRVIVPENAVQTYDMPVETAREIGALPHNGDLLHLLFLYHMRLNGVEVVREIRSLQAS